MKQKGTDAKTLLDCGYSFAQIRTVYPRQVKWLCLETKTCYYEMFSYLELQDGRVLIGCYEGYMKVWDTQSQSNLNSWGD